MAFIEGEYDCRIDEKGRIIIPMVLLRQVSKKAQGKFMLKKGFEGCLNIFPMNEWKVEREKVNQTNLFMQEDREFMRVFMSGATLVEIDSANRILIAKKLLEYAGIDKDVVLTAFSNRIEVWAKDAYDKQVNITKEEFSAKAQRVMGGLQQTKS
jgi:MraZ protein